VPRAANDGVPRKVPRVPSNQVGGASPQRNFVEWPVVRIIKMGVGRRGSHILRFVLDEVQKRVDID